MDSGKLRGTQFKPYSTADCRSASLYILPLAAGGARRSGSNRDFGSVAIGMVTIEVSRKKIITVNRSLRIDWSTPISEISSPSGRAQCFAVKDRDYCSVAAGTVQI